MLSSGGEGRFSDIDQLFRRLKLVREETIPVESEHISFCAD